MSVDGTGTGTGTGLARARRPLCVSVLAGALLGATQLGALDLPRMLAGGHAILDAGGVPRVNTLSWTHADFVYVNDKWGFMLLVTLAERLGGAAALAALKLLLGAAAGALLHLLAARAVPGPRAAGLAAAGLAMLSYRLHLRAEWISFLGVGAVLLLLPGVVAGRRRSWVACVALTPLWASMHSYWFLGPALLVWTAVWTRSACAFWTGLACVGAAAVSPHGLRNVLHPLDLLGKTGGGVLREAISELRPPFAGPWTAFHTLAVALLLLSAAAVVSGARRRDAETTAPLVLLLAASLSMDRNLALLGLALPLAAACLPAAWAPRLAWLGLVWLPAVLAPAIGLAPDRRPGLGWNADRFPVALVDEIEPWAGGLRFVNDLSIGSYLAARRGRAFIDGNTEGYPIEFLATYRRILKGELPLAEVDATYPNDGYLLRHDRSPTRGIILALFLSGDYAPTHWDGVATLFRRDLEPTAADERWRLWLERQYLGRARAWFAAEHGAGRLDPSGLPDDADARGALAREAVERWPYDRAAYEELATHYARRGDLDRAALCTRYATRIP